MKETIKNEQVKSKIIAGRKVKEYLFTGEVKLRLLFAAAQDYDGTDVRIDVELPLTDGIKRIMRLGKKQVPFGANVSTDVTEDIFHLSALRAFYNLTPEQRQELLIN